MKAKQVKQVAQMKQVIPVKQMKSVKEGKHLKHVLLGKENAKASVFLARHEAFYDFVYFVHNLFNFTFRFPMGCVAGGLQDGVRKPRVPAHLTLIRKSLKKNPRGNPNNSSQIFGNIPGPVGVSKAG